MSKHKATSLPSSGAHTLIALFTSMVLLIMGNAFQGLLLPIAGSAYGFSAFSLGVLGAAYFVGYAAGSLFAPFVIERVRHIRTFAAMGALACCMVLLHVLWPNEFWWWFCRIITGFALACLYTVIESWVNDTATPANRGRLMSMYMVLSFGATVAGQMLLMFYTPTDWHGYVVIAVLLTLSVLPLTLSTRPQPVRRKANIPPFLELWHLAPAAVFGVVMVGMANGAFWSLGAVYGVQAGMSTAHTTLFVSLIVLAGALCQWPVGWFSDKFDRRVVLLGIFIAASSLGIALGLTPTQQSDNTPLIILGFLWGFAALGSYGVAVAHAFDRVPAKLVVQTSGAMLFLFGVGSVVGPLLAGLLMDKTGAGGLFLFTATAHGIGAVYLLVRLLLRSAATERTHFMPNTPIPLPYEQPTNPDKAA
ncbi:MAG: MFS transporter [Alphaproteobacteria bacterium]